MSTKSVASCITRSSHHCSILQASCDDHSGLSSCALHFIVPSLISSLLPCIKRALPSARQESKPVLPCKRWLWPFHRRGHFTNVVQTSCSRRCAQFIILDGKEGKEKKKRSRITITSRTDVKLAKKAFRYRKPPTLVQTDLPF